MFKCIRRWNMWLFLLVPFFAVCSCNSIANLLPPLFNFIRWYWRSFLIYTWCPPLPWLTRFVCLALLSMLTTSSLYFLFLFLFNHILIKLYSFNSKLHSLIVLILPLVSSHLLILHYFAWSIIPAIISVIKECWSIFVKISWKWLLSHTRWWGQFSAIGLTLGHFHVIGFHACSWKLL